MALAANALLSVAELKSFLFGSGATQDTALESAINRASDLIQSHLGRRLVTPASDYVEYHTLRQASADLYLMDWPIKTITSVHEDSSRVYGASSLLTVDTDYIVSKPRGKLIRVSGSATQSWLTGFRAIKVTWSPEYAVADLPAHFKDAALHLASILWQEQSRKTWGITGVSDDQGNFTRVSVDHLPAYIRDRLESERLRDFEPTGERDS